MPNDLLDRPLRALRRRSISDVEPFERLRDDMDRMFHTYLRPISFGRPSRDGSTAFALSADLDVSETDDAVEVTLDLPGVAKKDVDISLSDSTLTIKGEREAESEEKHKTFHRVERSYGAFQRTIALPCEVDGEQTTAKMKDGVLRVTLPKTKAAKESERKIAVTAG